MIGSDPQNLANQYCGMYHVFRDTLFIQNGYDVVLRTHYARYTGEFVLHCHILDHEDAGMMANVQIVADPLTRPSPPRPTCRPCGWARCTQETATSPAAARLLGRPRAAPVRGIRAAAGKKPST